MSGLPEKSSTDHGTGVSGDLCNGRAEPANASVTRHRIGTIRRRQGLSLRTIAWNWNVDIEEVRRQEEESSDLTLSQFYRWQQTLGVPVADLLVDEDQELSNPDFFRAQLVKVMTTAVTIKETARAIRVQRLVTMLLAQLVEIMPDLADPGTLDGLGNRQQHPGESLVKKSTPAQEKAEGNALG